MSSRCLQNFSHLSKRVALFSFVLSISLCLVAQTRTPSRKAGTAVKPGAKAATPAQKPKFKGLFEPISYSEDLELKSVFFVDDKTGWVAGEAGTILHTNDAGETWAAQSGGDPANKQAAIDHLFFLDSTHGWAVGASQSVIQRKLLGTSDGETWRQVGTMGTPMSGFADYAFTSPTEGVFLSGGSVSGIFQTRDGGRTWKEVLPACMAKVKLQGLNKEVTCRLKDLFFLSSSTGFAVGAGSAGTVFVLKTSDGGSTWENLYVQPDVGHSDESYFYQDISFIDENTGFVVLSRADKLLSTTDGGKTWEEAPTSITGRIHFADADVGWIMDSEKFNFTTNGGKLWNTRVIRFPASMTAFSFPSRQRAYVVGRSGMVFRYSVVPFEKKTPDSIEAPAMPAKGAASASSK